VPLPLVMRHSPDELDRATMTVARPLPCFRDITVRGLCERLRVAVLSRGGWRTGARASNLDESKLEVTQIEALSTPDLSQLFRSVQAHIQSLRTSDALRILRETFMDRPGSKKRSEVLNVLDQLSGNVDDRVNTCLLFHGCSIDVSKSIACRGMVNLTSNLGTSPDFGFFGHGVYTTDCLPYAVGYSMGLYGGAPNAARSWSWRWSWRALVRVGPVCRPWCRGVRRRVWCRALGLAWPW